MAASDHLHPEQLQLFTEHGKPASTKPPVEPFVRPLDQRNQRQLFVNPAEHIDTIRGSVDYNGESWTDLWATKEAEGRGDHGSYAHGAGTYDSVLKHGVLNRYGAELAGLHGRNIHAPELRDAAHGPGFVQGEGHHRMAAARAVQEDTGRAQWVPVDYSGNTSYSNNRSSHGYEPSSEYEPTPTSSEWEPSYEPTPTPTPTPTPPTPTPTSQRRAPIHPNQGRLWESKP